MEAHKILHAEILDIIFEGRNKDYGAYELRKAYNSRLMGSLAIMFVMVCILLYFFTRPVITQKVLTVFIPETQTTAITDPAIPKDPVKKSSAQAAVKPAQNRTNPVIVTDHTPVAPVPTVQISAGSGADPGTATNFPQGPGGPTGDTTTTVADVIPPSPAEPAVYTSVQVQASFPGGVEAWRRYLQKNLDADLPLNNGAPSGTYRVIVRFIVSTDGSISDVEAETDHGYGMEKEAVNAIRRGPSWTPAKQNGISVKAYRRQPITFVVPE